MSKYWGKQIFTHGRFLKAGKKQKTEKKKERKKERKLVITLAKLRMAHAWCTQAAWAKNCWSKKSSTLWAQLDYCSLFEKNINYYSPDSLRNWK